VPFYDIANDNLNVHEASQVIQAYNTFVDRIAELGLHTAVDLAPILDGNEVIRAMGANKPGAWTGQVLARVIEWQLAHPDGTKDECETWLKAEQEAGRIRVEERNPSGQTNKRGKAAEVSPTSKKAKR